MRRRFFYLMLKIIPKPLVHLALGIKFILSGEYIKLVRRSEENERSIRMVTGLLLQKYDDRSGSYRYKNAINKYEAKIFSQNGEDGILLYLFSMIGTPTRRFVELGIGDGRQCNTANLSINFGWNGLLVDAKAQNVSAARKYYQQNLGERAADVRILHTRASMENINEALKNNGFVGEIDLLSIDIDGNDYWLWQAIEVISPRIVVIEYNASFGNTKPITIHYDPDFSLSRAHPSGFYYGASLPALAKLAEKKGYVLLGCETAGVNAFFGRKDVLGGKLEPVPLQEAYFPHERRSARFSSSMQMQLIEHLSFQEV